MEPSTEHWTSDLVTEDDSEKFILYHCPPCRSSRCLWLIKELGIENSVRVCVRKTGSVKDESYERLVHPHHTVPALTVPGQTNAILESGAICLYLADKFQRLLPTDEEKAEYFNSLDQWLEPLYLQWYHTEIAQRDQSLIDSMSSIMAVALAYLERHLSTRQFICGNRFTTADCVLGYNVWWANEMDGGRLIEGLNNIKAYLARLRDRPAFRQTFQLPEKE